MHFKYPSFPGEKWSHASGKTCREARSCSILYQRLTEPAKATVWNHWSPTEEERWLRSRSKNICLEWGGSRLSGIYSGKNNSTGPIFGERNAWFNWLGLSLATWTQRPHFFLRSKWELEKYVARPEKGAVNFAQVCSQRSNLNRQKFQGWWNFHPPPSFLIPGHPVTSESTLVLGVPLGTETCSLSISNVLKEVPKPKSKHEIQLHDNHI